MTNGLVQHIAVEESTNIQWVLKYLVKFYFDSFEVPALYLVETFLWALGFVLCNHALGPRVWAIDHIQWEKMFSSNNLRNLDPFYKAELRKFDCIGRKKHLTAEFVRLLHIFYCFGGRGGTCPYFIPK